MNEIETSMKQLSNVMKRDPEYAFSWHSNLTMSFFDSIPDSIQDWPNDDKMDVCNLAASNFMKTAFDVETSRYMLENKQPKKITNVLIESCSDSQLWYISHIGLEYELLGMEEHVYWVKDSKGYRNIVKKKDSALITRER